MLQQIVGQQTVLHWSHSQFDLRRLFSVGVKSLLALSINKFDLGSGLNDDFINEYLMSVAIKCNYTEIACHKSLFEIHVPSWPS